MRSSNNRFHKLIQKINQFWQQCVANMQQRIDDLRQPKTRLQRNHHTKKQHQHYDNAFYLNVTMETLKSVILHIVSFGLILFTLFIGLGIGYFASIIHKEAIPSYKLMKQQINAVDESATFYFTDKQHIATLPTDIVREKVSLDQMSPWLTKAIIATEDEYFYQNDGVMPKAIIRALISAVTGLGTQTGGSTLTQQLVKMQLLNSQETFKRKAVEILLALRVNKYFSKDEILQAYLNAAPFGRNNKGENIGGVEAAARGIFGKSANDLTLSEAAFIAGLPQSPFYYTPFKQNGTLKSDKELQAGITRERLVLFRMYRDKQITKQQYNDARKVDLKKEFFKKGKASTTTSIKYPYIYNMVVPQAEQIIAENLANEAGVSDKQFNSDKGINQKYLTQAISLMHQKDYRVYTTFNKDIYDQMQETAKQAGPSLGSSHQVSYVDETTGEEKTETEHVQNGSVLIDNQTGAIISFVGGIKYDGSTNYVNHINTLRQPGSSIKPLLVYGPAIENKLITSQTMLADFKKNFNKGTSKKAYEPTDYGNIIQNKFISARSALANSYNLPAVNLYQKVLQSVNVKPYMEKLGVPLTNSEYNKLGSALGGLDNGLSVTQMASAFTTFSNGGKRCDPYYITKIVDPNGKVIYQHQAKTTQVFSPATAWIMSNMMHSVITDGTAAALPSELSFSAKTIVGKTGTSNDYKDIWFIASTPTVTLASWIGYDNNWGSSYNLPEDSSNTNVNYWAQLMNDVYEEDPSILGLNQKRKKPSAVTSSSVLKLTGTLPGEIEFGGEKHKVTGEKTTAYGNDLSAPALSYNFGIGGSTSNYKKFWDNYYGLASGDNYGVMTKDGKTYSASSNQTAQEGATQNQNENTTTNDSTVTNQTQGVDNATTAGTLANNANLNANLIQ